MSVSSGQAEQISSKLLYDEPPLQVIPSLAKRIGLNEALVVQQLHYWLLNPKVGEERDGRRWIYNTIEDWVTQFPFWSRNTTRRILEGLEKKKIIITGNYNKLPIDRTKWYTLDYRLLEMYERPKKKGKVFNFGKSEKSGSTLANGLPNFGKPLPETPSENTNTKDSFFATFDKSQLYLVNSLDKQICSIPYATLLEVPANHRGWTTIIGVQLDKKRFGDYTIVETLPFKEESEDPKPPIPQHPPSPEPTIPDGYQWWFAGDKASIRHLLWLGTGKPKCKPKHWQHPNKWNPQLLGYTPCPDCLRIVNEPKPVPITKALNDAVAMHIEKIDPALAGGLTGTLAQKIAGVWRKKLGIDKLTAEHYQSIARSIPKFVEAYKAACEGCDVPKSPDKVESWYAQLLPIMEGKAKPESQPDTVPHPEIEGATMTRSQYRQWEMHQQAQKERREHGKQSAS